VLHRNMRADPESFLKAIAAFRPDIVVAVECIFTWYWLADLCAGAGNATSLHATGVRPRRFRMGIPVVPCVTPEKSSGDQRVTRT
jgi:hypothetical protein